MKADGRPEIILQNVRLQPFLKKYGIMNEKRIDNRNTMAGGADRETNERDRENQWGQTHG